MPVVGGESSGIGLRWGLMFWFIADVRLDLRKGLGTLREYRSGVSFEYLQLRNKDTKNPRLIRRSGEITRGTFFAGSSDGATSVI